MADKPRAKSKVARAMQEFADHQLHSGSKKGPLVTSRQQALAIGESEERKRGGKRRKHK